MAKRPPRHKVNHKQRADAIAALHQVVKNPDAAEYVKAKAAASIIFASKIDDGDAPDRDDDQSWRPVFLPPKNGDATVRYGQWHEGQRIFIVPDGFAREIRPEAFYAGVPKPAAVGARLALPGPDDRLSARPRRHPPPCNTQSDPSSGGDKYRVTGAVDIYDTGAPILDAAQALIAAGASPSDTLQASGADCTFSPMTIGKLAAPRKPPRQSDVRALARF